MVNNFLSKEIENEEKGTVQIGLFIQEISECLPRARHSGDVGGHAGRAAFSCSEQVGLAMKQALGILNSAVFPQNHCRESQNCGFC